MDTERTPTTLKDLGNPMLEQLQKALAAKAENQGWVMTLCEESNDIFKIGHYHVMLAFLPDSPERAPQLDAVDSLLRKALIFRGTLSQAGASDLNLFLVAPPGSAGSSKWETLAAEIESDDRVCRKLVWLPDSEGLDSERFLERSFLAQPWQSDAPAASIDALHILGNALNMPEDWKEALLDAELEGGELIRRLMEIEAKP